MNKTPKQAIIRLARFARGGNADVVARAMRMLGVKGVKEDEGRCVLAAYLGRCCPGYAFTVNGVEVAAFDAAGVLVCRAPTPKVAADVIERFDAGHYPELVEGRGCSG